MTQGKLLALSEGIKKDRIKRDRSPKREFQFRATVPQGRMPGLPPFPKEGDWSPGESGDPTQFPR